MTNVMSRGFRAYFAQVTRVTSSLILGGNPVRWQRHRPLFRSFVTFWEKNFNNLSTHVGTQVWFWLNTDRFGRDKGRGCNRSSWLDPLRSFSVAGEVLMPFSPIQSSSFYYRLGSKSVMELACAISNWCQSCVLEKRGAPHGATEVDP